MKVVVIAWGSLVWNRGQLAVTTEFQPNGPLLPIEFSRVSGDGRLTLVIDEVWGGRARPTRRQAPSTNSDPQRRTRAYANVCRAKKESASLTQTPTNKAAQHWNDTQLLLQRSVLGPIRTDDLG
jgi:hypothetical protein